MTIFENSSGSCTSNIAPGSDLSIFPSTSILSSFDMIWKGFYKIAGESIYKSEENANLFLRKSFLCLGCVLSGDILSIRP